MKQSPKISVVMSVYNGERYLHEAIESVLNQTFLNFEFIIINDGSIDKSLEIIQSYKDKRIVLINQDNTGLARALNNGLKIAKGKYIARIDADDICYPERFKIQIEFLEQNNDYVAVGSNADIIDEDGRFVYTTNQLKSNEENYKRLPKTPFIHPTVVFQKTICEKIGGYPDVPRIEDVLLFNKMSKYGKIGNIEVALIKYRISPFSLTTKSKKKDQIRIEKIIMDIINTNRISSNQIDELISINKNLTYSQKHSIYHLHLAKRYLFNNFNRNKFFENIVKSLKYDKLFISVYLFFILGLLPESFINFIYGKVK